MKSPILCLAFVLVFGNALANAASACTKTKNVLNRFLELDATTGRQGTEISQVMSDQDAPGWDTNTVIDNWKLGKCMSSAKDIMEIKVSYKVLGEIGSAPGTGYPQYTHNEHIEIDTYKVSLLGGAWKVSNANNFPPHVNVATAIKDLQDATSDNDMGRKKAMQEAVSILKNQNNN